VERARSVSASLGTQHPAPASRSTLGLDVRLSASVGHRIFYLAFIVAIEEQRMRDQKLDPPPPTVSWWEFFFLSFSFFFSFFRFSFSFFLFFFL